MNENDNKIDNEIDDDSKYFISEKFDEILKEVLWDVYEKEFAEFNDPEKYSPFRPSLRHRLAMERIFRRFERNVRKLKKERAAAEKPEKTNTYRITA